MATTRKRRMSRALALSIASLFTASFALAGCTTTTAQPAAPVKRRLMVCADPNNLPFSNDRGEGFENKLAELIAKDLDAEVGYVFWPQRRGFIRNTLSARRCDVVMGMPVGSERVLTTHPYYRSGYVFIYGPEAPRVRSLDDPDLQWLRIGVPLVGDDGANPPPVSALARRSLMDNLRGYPVYGDYRQDSPPAELVRAVGRGDIDIAIAWGPLAGYFARRAAPKLQIGDLPEEDAKTGVPFTFEIAMAVRPKENALRDELDAALTRKQAEVLALLDSFNVPRR